MQWHHYHVHVHIALIAQCKHSKYNKYNVIQIIFATSHNHGYSNILVLFCEVSNFLVVLPLLSTRSQHVVEVFQRGYLAYFGPPLYTICDFDPAFISSLMEAFLQNFNIKMITVSVTNHKTLLAEHGIKILSNLFV